MSVPAPLSPNLLGVRGRTAYDLEVVLVDFLANLFSGTRLDNPGVNYRQLTEGNVTFNPPPVRYIGAHSRWRDVSPDWGCVLEIQDPTTLQWNEVERYAYPAPTGP